MAMELTVCQDTPSSPAIAEVVRSIINRRNTYRAQRRVKDTTYRRGYPHPPVHSHFRRAP